MRHVREICRMEYLSLARRRDAAIFQHPAFLRHDNPDFELSEKEIFGNWFDEGTCSLPFIVAYPFIANLRYDIY
jgi:hypothetical protein